MVVALVMWDVVDFDFGGIRFDSWEGVSLECGVSRVALRRDWQGGALRVAMRPLASFFKQNNLSTISS